jgi:hypothetical protein
LNREEIRNPHLIYPGQVVVLDRNGPTLKLGKRIGGPQDRPLYEKRFPQVYSDPARNAIQSIPLRAILPFLSEPLIVDDADDIRAGIVVATQEGRVFTSPGDTIFATRINPEISNWNVYRKARPLKDPLTGELLGFEAAYLGQARVSAQAGVLAPDAGGETETAREGRPSRQASSSRPSSRRSARGSPPAGRPLGSAELRAPCPRAGTDRSGGIDLQRGWRCGAPQRSGHQCWQARSG